MLFGGSIGSIIPISEGPSHPKPLITWNLCMEENAYVLPQPLASSSNEPDTGFGKPGLKVRLAPDMDESFLQRLNKVCSSFLTENPSSRSIRSLE